MKIIVVALYVPMPDRASVYLRFHHFLKALSTRHTVLFYSCCYGEQVSQYGEAAVHAYEKNMLQLGIQLLHRESTDLLPLFQKQDFDVVLFEHYHPAMWFMDDVRFRQPHAHIVVDTIDVNFNRLMSKAKMTQSATDLKLAQETRSEEIATYRKADLVIAISDHEKSLLERECRSLKVSVIPNIHKVQELICRKGSTNTLLFVGNFEYDANVDAIKYFCRDILPFIRKQMPEVRLKIVGNAPTRDVEELSGGGIEVLGYVPDLKALYRTSDVSIAPLRYGGGLKGKIGEALSFGLPVVSTTVGLEGFGLSHGKEILVGDTPEDFASAVIRLLQDEEFCESVRVNGWRFIKKNLSDAVIEDLVLDLFDKVTAYPINKLPAIRVMKRSLGIWFDRYIRWRFKKETDASQSMPQ